MRTSLTLLSVFALSTIGLLGIWTIKPRSIATSVVTPHVPSNQKVRTEWIEDFDEKIFIFPTVFWDCVSPRETGIGDRNGERIDLTLLRPSGG